MLNNQFWFNNKTNAEKIEMAFQPYAYNFLSEGKS